MNITQKEIQEAARQCLVTAGTTYREDQFNAYQRAITAETDENSRWVLDQIYENARIAKHERLPLCDDMRYNSPWRRECGLNWIHRFAAVPGLDDLGGSDAV